MYSFIFTKIWEKKFLKLWSQDQERVLKKLKTYKNNWNLWNNFKSLIEFLPATHRIRIWNIRIILQKIDEKTFYILDVWYRWDIYK
jgi:mRNA-degrading endonuclease RelE of RelBE toxin-antitoxin system